MEPIEELKDDLQDAQRELRALTDTLMHIRQQREELKDKVADQATRINYLEKKIDLMMSSYSNLEKMYDLALERNERMRDAMVPLLHRSTMASNSKKECECSKCVAIRSALEHSFAEWKLI